MSLIEKSILSNVLFLVAHLYGPEVSRLKLVSKTSLNDKQFEKIKKNFYNDIPNIPLQTLRRESDEQYMLCNQIKLSETLASITKHPEFPEDLVDPDQTFLARGFYILWLRDYYKSTPSKIFDLSMEINTCKEWVVKNERKFFEVIHGCLCQ